MKNHLVWICLAALIVVCLSLNYYGGGLLSTLAILLLYGMVLIAKDDLELSLVPIVMVFLSSYSKITTNVFGISIPRETVHNIFFFLCMLKLFFSGNIKRGLPTYKIFVYIFIAYITLLQTTSIKVTQGLAVFSQCFVALKVCELITRPSSVSNYYFLKVFAIVLMVSLIGEFVYGTITPLEVRYSKFINWRADQFPGIFDPNNCCIHFFIGLIFLYIYKECYNWKYRLFILLFYCFVIIQTVSFSGLVGMVMFICLMMYKWFSSKNRWKMILVMAMGTIGAIYIVTSGILANFGNSSIPGLSSLALRLNDMNVALDSGDTNALTSNREQLWLLYMTRFLQQDTFTQIIGSPQLFKDIVAVNEVASHNFYIDILVQYGYLGVGLLSISIIAILIHYLREKSIISFVIALWFAVLFFSRTLPEYFLFFTLIIHDVYARNKARSIRSLPTLLRR